MSTTSPRPYNLPQSFPLVVQDSEALLKACLVHLTEQVQRAVPGAACTLLALRRYQKKQCRRGRR